MEINYEIINPEDVNFIKYLLENKNVTFNNDYYLIKNIIKLFKLNKNNNLNDNNELLNIFNRLDKNNLLYSNLKKLIAEKLLLRVMKSVNLGKISKDLFKNEDFFQYIFNTKLLSQKLLNTFTPLEFLLSNNKILNYYDITDIIINNSSLKKINIYKFLISESKYFNEKLVKLNKSHYFNKLILKDVLKYVNFIKLINKYVFVNNKKDNKTNDINCSKIEILMQSNIKTYLMLLDNINNIFLSSKESIELFELFSTNNLKDHDLLINRCTNAINQCYNIFNDFFSNNKFNNYMISVINTISLNKKDKHHVKYENFILPILPIVTFKNYRYATDTIYNLNDIKYKIINQFKYFLTNDDYNIHQKVKFLLDISIPEFVEYFIKDNNFILENEFVNLFIDIEKYNESNGFYDKLRLRSIIINIFNESFKITKKINFICDSNLSKKKYKTFFTLLLSEYNIYTTKIEKFKKNIIDLSQNDKYNLNLYPNMCSYILNLKNMINFYKIINKYFNLKDIFNDTFYLSKIVQLNHTIMHSHYYVRIYTELPLYNMSKLSLNLLSPIFAEKLFNYIQIVYNDIYEFYNNNLFIKYISKNKEIYPIDILEKTKSIFGEFSINLINGKNQKINEIIDNFIEKLNFQINDENFNKPIPDIYLDPLLLTPIKDPIELPNTKNIIDKSTILNHLVFSKSNPFDGLPLTEDDLYEYNNKIEVIERINIFKFKFNQWKNNNNKK